MLSQKAFSCSRHPPYLPEFRQQIVDLIHTVRDPADPAGELEFTAQAIRSWIGQADRQEGGREEKGNGLSTAERDELARLRRKNEQPRVGRGILSRPVIWRHLCQPPLLIGLSGMPVPWIPFSLETDSAPKPDLRNGHNAQEGAVATCVEVA